MPPLVRAALALHDERTLLPFVAGELEPVQVMYKLSGVSIVSMVNDKRMFYTLDCELCLLLGKFIDVTFMSIVQVQFFSALVITPFTNGLCPGTGGGGAIA